MVKKNKKKKAKISDYGAQTIIKIDGKLIRVVDQQEFRLTFGSATGDRRIEKVHNSVLQNYYARDLLDITNRDRNQLRYIAGNKFEITSYHAGLQQNVTMQYKDRSQGSMEEFNTNHLDSLNKFREAYKYLGNLSKIAWHVIIDNKPAKKQMNEFRESLEVLIDFYKL